MAACRMSIGCGMKTEFRLAMARQACRQTLSTAADYATPAETYRAEGSPRHTKRAAANRSFVDRGLGIFISPVQLFDSPLTMQLGG